MKLQKRSPLWLSLALAFGLSATPLAVNAQDESPSAESGADNAMTGHHSQGGYKGHHKGQHGGQHGMAGKRMSQANAIELDLDEDQLQEMAEIQKELRSDLTDLKVERYEASLRLEELYGAEELDAGDITDQQQKVFDAIKEITELQVEAQQAMRDLLTSGQREKLMRSGDWMMPN